MRRRNSVEGEATGGQRAPGGRRGSVFEGDRSASPKAWALALALAVSAAGCGGESTQATSSSSGDASCGGGGGSGGGSTRVEPADDLTPLRLLRRASITLLGNPPTDAQLAELLAKPSPDEQFAYVDQFIDAALEDPRFYQITFELARTWLSLPAVDQTADAPEYGPKQQRVLTTCAADTARAGSLHYYRDSVTAAEICSNAPTDSVTIEPWWAPGTMVTLIGNAANVTNMRKGTVNGNPVDIPCNDRPDGACGCSANAASCWFDPGTYSGTDALYQQLYETTQGVSKTIARDVLTSLDKTKGFEFLDADPLYAGGALKTACIGSADTCGPVRAGGSYDFALRLLKSNLVTSLTLRATSIANTSFDVHFSGGAIAQTSHLRIALEAIGQMLNEMQLTPASSGSGTLLDETLVYIYSDFGRTFARSGQDGTDHHPATCGILVGGNVRGNQMLGGYDETAEGSPLGAPVPLIEESGEKAIRPPMSQDIAATVIRAFGLAPGKDFFIPGGYGEFEGAILPG